MLSLCDSTFVFQISAQYTTRQKSNSLLCLLCLFVALVLSVGICVICGLFRRGFPAFCRLLTVYCFDGGGRAHVRTACGSGGQVVMFGGGAEN